MTEQAGEARSSIVLRLVTAFAVAAVALSLWVGFFYGGDFKKAWAAWTGTGLPTPTAVGSAQVEAHGTARLDGSCSDKAIATKTTDAALGAAKTDATGLCAADPKARGNVRVSLRLDEPGEPEVKTNGKKCIVHVSQTWTCVFDSR